MKTSTTLLVLSVAVVSGTGGNTFFGSVASEDYYLRNNVFDCPRRYYPPQPPQTEYAVSGGVRAFDGEYRHMVAIGWVYDGNIRYLCGGSIIHENFILTAAHCSAPVNGIYPTTVRAGDTDLGSNENDFMAQQRNISRILRHPLHRHIRSYHDLALIELDQALSFHLQVSPACLWHEKYIPQEPLNIAGFGEVNLGEGPSLTLQHGYVMDRPTDECEKMLPSRRIPDGILESQFCASHDTMDTCRGDSGGPIELRRIDLFKQEFSLIVGITSFGTACGSGSIGVYTKISHYIDWIEMQTNQSYEYNQCMSRILHTKYKPHGITFLPTNKPFPYVHLVRNRSAELEYDCMGTLIDDQFVVTSAFCATHEAGSPEFIYVPTNQEFVPIETVIPHPQYDVDTLANNIALLKLGKFLERDLKPACLAERKYSTDKQTVNFMLNSIGPAINYFFRRFIPESDQCPESFDGICMQNPLPLIPNICQVMNGAPILKGDVDGTPFLYGIMDANNDDCNGKLRGTLIEPHLEWIESVIRRYLRREVLIFD